MIESAVLRELRTALVEKDPERTGVLPWEEVSSSLAHFNIVLSGESLILTKQYFVTESGVRYQELLRNLHASLTDGGRTWRVYRPSYTFESRNLRESEGNTMVRKCSYTPPPPVVRTPSVITQLQSDRVDYLTLGLARETFQRLDRDRTGTLTPTVFEQCFRTRHISPTSRRLLMDQSKNEYGLVEFAKFNQLIENYKYAPLKQRREQRHRDIEESCGLLPEQPEDVSLDRRVTANLQKVSQKLKEKYSSSLRAFRACRRGAAVGIDQFTTEMAYLGLNFPPEETKELFTQVSQGSPHLSFELFQSLFEARTPRRLPLLPTTTAAVQDQLKSDAKRLGVSPLRRRVKRPARKQTLQM